jgi:hypothetical protein
MIAQLRRDFHTFYLELSHHFVLEIHRYRSKLLQKQFYVHNFFIFNGKGGSDIGNFD